MGSISKLYKKTSALSVEKLVRSARVNIHHNETQAHGIGWNPRPRRLGKLLTVTACMQIQLKHACAIGKTKIQ